MANLFLQFGLFINNDTLTKKKLFPTDIPQTFKGKIGIKFKNGYYVPSSEAIFENIFHRLLDSSDSTNNAGHAFESFVYQKLANFFKNTSIHSSYYCEKKANEKSQAEQDFIVVDDTNIFIIECKSQSMNEVFRDQTKSSNRLKNKFSSVILKGAKQCTRVSDYIMKSSTNDVQFFNKDNKPSFKITNAKGHNIFKIIITLDDFLNLAESSFLMPDKYQSTWVVNLSSLERIFWKCATVKKFVDYLRYRVNPKNISSLGSNELDHYGHYVDPFAGQFIIQIPQFLTDTKFQTRLGSGYLKLFDGYDLNMINEFTRKYLQYHLPHSRRAATRKARAGCGRR